MPCKIYLDTTILCALADPPAGNAYARSETHAEGVRICPGSPDDVPEVSSFTSDFLRSLPARNRAMYKYVWLRHVQEYEAFMRAHPEMDPD